MNEDISPAATPETPPVKQAEAPESYFFVGSDSMLTGPGYAITLNRFGQEVKLTPSQAINHAAHGARLVPSGVFHDVRFTKEELAANTEYRHPDEKNEAFMGKRKAAITAADTFQRESLEALKEEK